MNYHAQRPSDRELEILSWLHKGKTINEIGQILGIADITIKKHIANVKRKSGCFTMFQLGEYFSNLNTMTNN